MGRDVTVESDHKPLEAIMKRPQHVAPLRLQRMLVQLQRFPGITVVYKRGESLHLADALSRAHLEEYLTNAEQLDINLVEHVSQTNSWPSSLKQPRKMRSCRNFNKSYCLVGQILEVTSPSMHSNSGTTEMNYQ